MFLTLQFFKKVLAWILSFEKVEREKSEERKKKTSRKILILYSVYIQIQLYGWRSTGCVNIDKPRGWLKSFSFFFLCLSCCCSSSFLLLLFTPFFWFPRDLVNSERAYDFIGLRAMMEITIAGWWLLRNLSSRSPPTVCACKWGCETRGLECIRTTVSWNRVQLAPPPGGACCFSSSFSFLCCWFLDILNPSAFLVGGERKKTNIERTTTYTYKRTLLWAGNDVNGIALDQSSSLLFYGWYYREEEEEARSNKYCGIGNKETLPNRILLLLQPWARTIPKMWLG